MVLYTLFCKSVRDYSGALQENDFLGVTTSLVAKKFPLQLDTYKLIHGVLLDEEEHTLEIKAYLDKKLKWGRGGMKIPNVHAVECDYQIITTPLTSLSVDRPCSLILESLIDNQPIHRFPVDIYSEEAS